MAKKLQKVSVYIRVRLLDGSQPCRLSSRCRELELLSRTCQCRFRWEHISQEPSTVLSEEF